MAEAPVPGAAAPGRVRRRISEDERRTQIIRATIATVAEHGYDGVSLARIVDQAQVSKGLISHYFADRDAAIDVLARPSATPHRSCPGPGPGWVRAGSLGAEGAAGVSTPTRRNTSPVANGEQGRPGRAATVVSR